MNNNPTDLTRFQLDLLRVIERDGPIYGLGIKSQLEALYDEEINHGRLYPNLDDLVKWGFVEKTPRDRRSNNYEVTARGESLLDQRRGWLVHDDRAETQPPAIADGGQEVEKFEIDLPDPDVAPLSRNDTITHIEHGPMRVDQIRCGGSTKTLSLVSELGPEAFQLSADELREKWGEEFALDPAEIREPRVGLEGITVQGVDAEVAVTVSGEDEDAVETVAMYLHDRAVRALRAVAEDDHPDSVDGCGIDVPWQSEGDDDV